MLVPRWPRTHRDQAWLDKCTTFLGSEGHFDYWGDPVDGHVLYVGNPEIGCGTGSFGDRMYWRSTVSRRDTSKLTPEGVAW